MLFEGLFGDITSLMFDNGTIAIPICALCTMWLCPNSMFMEFPISSNFFNDEILKIADGFMLEMWPRGCQFGGAIGSGQLK
jgi:hypothetical protein